MTPRLRSQAFRWMAWATLTRVGQDALRIASRLLLARLLWPEEFGVFTLAITVLAGAQVLTALHVGTLLVQTRELTEEMLSSAHWTQLAVGLTATVALIALASPLGQLTGHEAVSPLLRVMAVQVALEALLMVPRAWLLRRLAFRQLASSRLWGEGTGTAVAVVAAAAGAGVWALAIQEVLADLVELALLRAMVPWRPLRHWSRAELGELLRFAWPLMAHRGIAYVTYWGDRFLIGRTFGEEVLGLYAVALRLVEAVSHSIGGIFDRVAFPAFARVQDSPEMSRRGFLEASRAQALLTFPIVVAIASLAGNLVPLVLGSQWTGAIPFTQVVAARVLLGSLVSLPRASLLGRGRRWSIFSLGALGLGLSLTGWLIGMRWGPLGVAAGGVAAAAGLVLASLVFMVRELGIRARDWGLALLPPAAGAGAMALAIRFVEAPLASLLPGRGIAVTVAMLAIGLAAYLLALAPWLPGEIRRYRELLQRDMFRRGGAARD